MDIHNRAVTGGVSALERRFASGTWFALAMFGLLAMPGVGYAADPIAGDDFVSARSGPGGGEQVTIDVSLNDSDPDGDTLSYVLASGEFLGTVDVAPDGLVTYTAPSEFNGSEAIGIFVSDGLGGEVISTLTVTVIADEPPTAFNDSATLPSGSSIQIDVLANDTDIDDTLSYDDFVIRQPPANGTVTQSCEGGCEAPVYEPNPGFVGSDSFSYYVRDPLGAASNDATVTISVTVANGPPTAVDDDYTVLSAIDSGGSSTLDVLGNDSDIDGDPLTVTSVTQPAAGTVTLEGGTVTFRPQTYFRGVTTFTYEVWDGIPAPPGDPSHYATATVTVTVENRPPNPQSPTATTIAGRSVGFAAISTEPDPELDSVSVTSFEQPSNGSVVASGSTGFEYTPNPGFTGVDTFNFVISDPFGATAASVATVTVTANTPPVAGDDVGSSRAGPTAGVQVDIDASLNDSDVDGDPLSYDTGTLPANGTVIVSPSGLLRYTPNAGFVGTDNFTYTVSDGVNAPVAGSVSVTVVADLTPVAVDDAASTPSTQVPANSAIQIAVLANDTDGDDTLSYDDIVIVQQPANGTLTQSCVGNCLPPEYQPNAGFSGTDTFTYRAVDPLGAQSNIATVTITVTTDNTAPVAADDAIVLPLNLAPQTIDPRTNDTDADGDPLTITAVTQASAGTVTFTTTSVTYTNSGSFSGSDSFTYTVSDGQGGTATATVAVSLAANSPPTAGADSGTTRSGPTAGEQVNIDASLNDSDVDGDPLSYDTGTLPANGTVIVSPSGLLRYTPNAGFVGTDNFTYTVSDGVNAPVAGNVSVTVVADLTPVAVDDAASTPSTQVPANSAIRIAVLANDTDGDDTLSYNDIVIVQQPANGTLTQSCVGNCLPPEYQPNAGFSGTDTFTYRAVDALGAQSNIATVTVTVTSSNSPPTVGADSGTTRSGPTAGEEVSINAALNDSDVDGDPLSYNAGTQPTNGTVIVSPTGLLRYTPNAGFVGTDNFAYTVTDGVSPDVTGNVSVTVVADIPPVAVDDTATTQSSPSPATSAVSIPVLANDTDGDGDVLAYRDIIIVTQPANGSVSQSCVGACLPPEYRPNANFSGTDTFTYRAVDPLGGQSNIATVTITVSSTNSPPVVATDSGTARSGPAAGEQITINAAANDSDPDGDPLTYTLAGGSFLGSASISSSGTITYTPPAGYTGGDSFSYEVSDGINPPVVSGVNITVVADVAPVASDDALSTAAGTPVQVPLLANDTDSDGDTLSYADVSIVTLPANGTVTLNCSATCQPPTYQPTNGFSGTDTFTYQVVDALGATSNTATVRIDVTASNVAPVAVISGGNRSVADTDNAAGEAVAMDGRGSTDSDGTIVAYQWSVNGQAAGTGAQPTLTLADGPNTVSLVVTDNTGISSTPATVTITVAVRVLAPVVTIRVGSTTIPDSDGQPGERVPFEGSATDSDGTVAVSTFQWYVNDVLVPAANGQANPTLLLDNGANTIVLNATDNSGAVGSATIAVTIGEPGTLAELPGVEGDPNLESTAAATDNTCSSLLKADPATLTEEQVNLRATCNTIYANAEQNPAATTDALEQIAGEQITAQQSTAIDFTSAQLFNVAGRLTALRQGAKGFSVAGLNVTDGQSAIPVATLASIANSMFGEGGGAGDDEGGLLDDRLGIFLNGSVRFGDKDATARESGFSFDTLGVTAGMDYRFTDSFVAGFAMGYGTASADFDKRGGSQDSDSYAGSLYGSWYGDRSYVDGILSYGSVSYDTIRNINLFDGAIVDTALGATDGTQMALGMSTGYDFGKGGLRFGPNLALNYIRVDIDGFDERTTGTSGLAMAYGDQSADSLTMKAGAHFNYSLSRKWGVISPQARFDLVREFRNEAQKVSVRYANDPIVVGPGSAGSTFTIFTDDPDDYYFLWAIGFAAQFVNGLSGFVDYEQTEALDTITSGELSFGVRYQTKFR